MKFTLFEQTVLVALGIICKALLFLVTKNISDMDTVNEIQLAKELHAITRTLYNMTE